MNKLENTIINNIRLLSLDMQRESGTNYYKTAFTSVPLFYSLYMNHLIYDRNNEDFVNRDRILVTDEFLPTLYSTLHLFGFNISLDNLKEYRSFDSITSGFATNKTSGIELGVKSSDIMSTSIGISLGEKRCEEEIKKEQIKNEIISFHTFVVCKYQELFQGNNLQALHFIKDFKINKLHIIVLKDENDDKKDESLLDYMESLDIDVLECKNDLGSIDKTLEAAKDFKNSNVIIITPSPNKDISFKEKDYITEEELNNLRTKYKIEIPFNVDNYIYNEIKESLDKRLSKKLNKWKESVNSVNNTKVTEILELLNTKKVIINYNIDNIKINDNYEEELTKGNSKILNLVASKSPFIYSLSTDFNTTLCQINNSNNNIELNNVGVLGGLSLGLSYLGFKVFVSTPLINANNLHSSITTVIKENLPVTYIFTNDNLLDNYKDYSVSYELNSLRLIPNLINIRPADINEIIGTYDIINSTNKVCTIILSNEKVKKLNSTNPKYVVAGAYRVRRERGEANGVLISSGREVELALKLAEELYQYNIDLRVVSIPSKEIFSSQGERYKYTLLPKDLKTFVLEFSTPHLWGGYATDDKYILGVNTTNNIGTKEEILKNNKLDMDSLKTRIIELYRDNN